MQTNFNYNFRHVISVTVTRLPKFAVFVFSTRKLLVGYRSAACYCCVDHFLSFGKPELKLEIV